MGRHSQNCPCKNTCKKRTKMFIPEIKKFLKLKKHLRCDYLKNCSECFIKFISDLATGILHSDVKLPTDKYKKMKKHKNLLLLLAKKKTSSKIKRHELLKQKGGFLHILLPAFLTTAVSMLGNALVK